MKPGASGRPRVGQRGRLAPLLGAAFLACCGLVAAQAREPIAQAAGRHAGELCVLAGDGPANCGPAELVFRGSRLRVQVSDIVYRLTLRSSQAEVVLMHGAMQIDEFVADYRWTPQGLQFSDGEKSVRYDVRWPGAGERGKAR